MSNSLTTQLLPSSSSDAAKIQNSNNNHRRSSVTFVNNDHQQANDKIKQENSNNKKNDDNGERKFFRPGSCGCLPPIIRNPLKKIWKFLNTLNYVAVLLSFTAACCLFFAIVLYIDGPMTRLETDMIVTVTSTTFNVSNFSWVVLSQVSLPLLFTDTRQDVSPRCHRPISIIDPSIVDPLNYFYHGNNENLGVNNDSWYFQNGTTQNDDDSPILFPQRINEVHPGYNITTITNFTNVEFVLVQRERIKFREALFVSVSAFTGSGLSSVDYSFWETEQLVTMSLTMTFGSTVLLTILPAILRYFALAKERKKLIQILLSTGAYDDEDDGNDEVGKETKYNHPKKNNNNNTENLKNLRFTGNEDDDEELEVQSPTNEQISRVGLVFLDGSGDTKRIPYPSSYFPKSNNYNNSNDDKDHHDEATTTKRTKDPLLSLFEDDDIMNATAGAAVADEKTSIIINPAETTNMLTLLSNNASFSSSSNGSKHLTNNNNKNNNNNTSGSDSPSSSATAGAVSSPLSPSSKRSSDRQRANTILGFTTTSNRSGSPLLQNSQRRSQPVSPHQSFAGNINDVPMISLTNASSDFADKNSSFNNNNNNPPRKPTLLVVPLSSDLLTKEDSQETQPKRINDVTSSPENKSSIITFGQRIVYEDGLAHVNQQIDICLIIIFGAIIYTIAVHLVSAIIITIWAPSDAWNFGFSLFHVISCFNNAGFAMPEIFEVSGSPVLMIVMTLVMAAGNSLYPIFFRLILQFIHWIMWKYTSSSSSTNSSSSNSTTTTTTSFIFGQPVRVWQHSLWLFLKYPRRFYTHIFSPRSSLVLFSVWFVMTVIGCLLMIPELVHDDILSPDVPDAKNYKFLIALFQTVSVRQTGIAIVRMDRITTGHLVWWILAMYVAAYPLILSVRSSSGRRTETANSISAKNDDDEAAAEKAEAIDATTTTKKKHENSSSSSDDELDSEAEDEEYQKIKNGGVTPSVVQEEATAVMTRDLFWLWIAVIIICYCENQYNVDESINHDYAIVLRVIFEVVSSFANVGLSLNIVGDVPNASYSASLKNVLSPLVLILVMYFGKHRGVPQTVDEAISIHVRKYEFSGEFNPDEKEEKNGNDGEDQDENNNNSSHDVSMTEFPTIIQQPNHVVTFALTEKDQETHQRLTRKTSLLALRKREIFRRRVEGFYAHYNPSRIPQVDRIISAFEGNPNALLKNLEATYGPDVNKKALEREEKKLFKKMSTLNKRKNSFSMMKNREASVVVPPSSSSKPSATPNHDPDL